MPRFVVLLHETPPGYPRGTHYDVMLEHGAMLRTWALDSLPAEGKAVLAERLLDHRPDYLDYEGIVAGERGSVSRVDRGDYSLVEESSGRIIVNLSGAQLRGMLTIAQDENDQRWRVSFSPG